MQIKGCLKNGRAAIRKAWNFKIWMKMIIQMDKTQI